VVVFFLQESSADLTPCFLARWPRWTP